MRARTMGTVFMKDFIHDIRTDRKREKADYKAKGYSVSSNYKCLAKVDVVCNKMKYSYNVQADRNEIRFFLANDKSNLYLSLFEIYDLIHRLPGNKRSKYKAAFYKHISNDANTECSLKYKGIEYELPACVEFPNSKIFLDTLGLEIESAQIYFLIHLIQSKSNSMFERSTDDKKANINGIYRLYSALLRKRSGSSILYDKGWIWNSKLNKFVLDSQQNGRDNTKWTEKYYLTETEYKNILGSKKS